MLKCMFGAANVVQLLFDTPPCVDIFEGNDRLKLSVCECDRGTAIVKRVATWKKLCLGKNA